MKISSAHAHNRRVKRQRREEKADQLRLCKENAIWEEAEEAADDYEYQRMLEAFQAESLKMAAMNNQRSSDTKTRTSLPIRCLVFKSMVQWKKRKIVCWEC
ncbi:unnamed protein product [Mortierella alpina]